MANQAPTFRNLVAAFTDFLTVAIHTILHERGIYPATSFLSVRKYNLAVRQNRHPAVCEWINDAIVALEAQLLKGVVDRVYVVMYSRANQPLERFVFDVSRLPTVSEKDLDMPIGRKVNGESVAVLPTVDIEEQFRATMSRLTNCSASLKPLPERCTFTIAIELKGEDNAPVSHPQAWIPAQPRPSTLSQESRAGDGQDQVQTTPLRAVRAGDMILETWIEESHNKFIESSQSTFSTQTSDFE